MNKVRVGVIGVGFGQQVHIPAFRRAPDCEVAAVCARTQDKAKAVAVRLGIEHAFDDWRCVIEDESIQAVAIAVPPTLQPEIAMAAMASGKGVFCEKPLATSTDQALEMVAVARRTGLANVVDFEFPEAPAWRMTRQILAAAGVENIRHFAVHWNVETYAFRMGLDTWKVRRAQGGGALFLFLSHVFYNLEWLVGPIESLTCHCPKFSASCEAFLAMTVELQSGAVGSISVSTDAFLGSGQRWEFYGNSETLILTNDTDDYINGFDLRYGSKGSGRLDNLQIDAQQEPGIDGRVAAVTPIVTRFIQWVQGGPATLPDWNAGLRIQQLLDSAIRSNTSGQRVHCS